MIPARGWTAPLLIISLMLGSGCRSTQNVSPESLAGLQERENRIQAVVREASPAVILLDSIRQSHLGSGVLISSNGLFLTAAHVLGSDDRVFLVKTPNGYTASAEALWIDEAADIGLGRITAKGETWPFVPLATNSATKAGDWVVSLGYPNGIINGRIPAARLGSIRRAGGFLISDSAAFKGDSGGALLNLDGELIGVHSWGIHSPASNAAAPVEGAAKAIAWAKTLSQDPPAKKPGAGWLQGMRFQTSMISSGTWDYLALTKVPVLGTKRGWHLRPRGETSRHRPETLASLQMVVADAANATVSLHNKAGQQLALGTIIDSSGRVLSKASELEALDHARLSNGRRVSAEPLRHDKKQDLALVQVGAAGLPTAAILSLADTTRAGKVLIAPAPSGAVLSYGVLARPGSLSRREVAIPPTQISLITRPVPQGLEVMKFVPEAVSDAIGFRKGDIVQRVGDDEFDEAAADRQDVKKLKDVVLVILRQKQSFPADVIRDGKPIKLTLGRYRPISKTRVGVERWFGRWLRGEANKRRSGFTKPLRYDAVLRPNEMGGPVVDLEGNVVGINIARASREQTLVLSAGVIEAFLRESAP